MILFLMNIITRKNKYLSIAHRCYIFCTLLTIGSMRCCNTGEVTFVIFIENL